VRPRQTRGGGIDEAWIVALCATKSIDDVMLELGCSRPTVHKALRRSGVTKVRCRSTRQRRFGFTARWDASGRDCGGSRFAHRRIPRPIRHEVLKRADWHGSSDNGFNRASASAAARRYYLSCSDRRLAALPAHSAGSRPGGSRSFNIEGRQWRLTLMALPVPKCCPQCHHTSR
jgi:hypothetical protein